MKIAVVVTGGLHPSGVEQVVPSWLELFSSLAGNHEIHAFVLRHLPAACSYDLRGFRVHDLGRPSAAFGLTRMVQERALAQAVSVEGPFEVIHGIWGDPAAQLAARLGKQLGIPSIATFDSGEFESLPAIEYGSQRTIRGRAAIAEALTATRTHVCSKFMAARVEAFGALPAIIPLTSVHGARRPRSREPHEPLSILQVASLSRVKNQQLLIDAAALVEPAIVSRVDFVGEDTLDGALQRYATELKVADRVFFHGFKPQRELDRFYAGADVYVQTSLHEAAGVSVLEAAAAGLPVIGTRAGYVADWASRRAIAVAANARELADALIALQADPATAAAMAARAQKWSTANNVASMTAKFDALYRDTARTATPSP
jgi:glycosyltransferase involved in cell wall biosynthesis